MGERTEECGAREVEEETGVRVRIGKLLGVYSDPKRDPRGHTVTVLYSARPTRGTAPRGGDDADEAKWFTRREVAKLDFAFDHGEIVREQFGRPGTRRSAR